MMFGILYDILYMLPVFWGAGIYINSQLAQPIDSLGFSIVSVLISISISAFLNIKSKFKYLIPGLVVIIAIATVLVHVPEERMEFLNSNIWIVVLLFCGIFTSFLTKLAGKYTVARRSLAVLIIGVCATFMTLRHDMDKLSLILLFLEVMVCVASDVQTGWIKTKDTDIKRHLVYVTPFLIVIALAVYKIPARETPYDWKLAIAVWEKIEDAAISIARLLPGEDESFDVAGFSDNAGLGGMFESAPKNMLEITIPQIAGNRIYLKGKSFDTFTGREWVSTNSEPVSDNIFDLAETQCAVKQYDSDNYKDYIRTVSLSIEYKNLRSRELLVPFKVETYADGAGRIKTTEYQDAILATKRINSGYEYQAKYNRLNSNHDIFTGLVESTSIIDESIWKRNMSNIIHGNMTGYEYENYKEWQTKISMLYKEKLTISEELRGVLNDVYDGATTDWDKLKKLEAWLGSFKYTIATGKLPVEIDTPEKFLDYFLLESKEGYCIHFATAFVLIARGEGMPARFVQGCYVPRTGAKVLVTSDMAHAWAEVYFENLGWTMWEPSPGYKSLSAWAPTVKTDKTSVTVVPEGFYDHDENETAEENTEKEPFNYMVGVTIFIVIIVFSVVFLFIYRYTVAQEYKRLNTTARYKRIFWFNLGVLEMLGMPLGKEETLTEYYIRLLKVYDATKLEFIPKYEEIVYSNSTPGDDDLVDIAKCQKAIIEDLDCFTHNKKMINRIKLCLLYARGSNR